MDVEEERSIREYSLSVFDPDGSATRIIHETISQETLSMILNDIIQAHKYYRKLSTSWIRKNITRYVWKLRQDLFENIYWYCSYFEKNLSASLHYNSQKSGILKLFQANKMDEKRRDPTKNIKQKLNS